MSKPKSTLRTARRKNTAAGSTRLVAKIQRTTEALTQNDMGAWRHAWQWAINAESPTRRWLYDIYRDALIDAHLSGCIKQREEMVLARSFRLTAADGVENDEAHHYFDQEWFRNLMRHILDSVYWGHSLIELGNVITDGDGCPAYDCVTLLPRKYVIPEHHRVITTLGQDWRTGIDYHEEPFFSTLIEAGQPDDLGLLLKAASQTIPKKNMLAFWDTFGEIFGMPMRIGHTTLRDDREIRKMEGMMQNMSTEFWAIFPEGTDIEVVESSKGDAFNVYDKRIERANSEISKLIIGQTMTIEDGSSLSQSQTHLQVLENIVESDAKMLAAVINNQLLPRMVRDGFPIDGLRFEWDDTVDYTPEQQRSIEEMLLARYDIDPAYFLEKYGIPCSPRAAGPEEALSLAKQEDSTGQKPFFD